MTLNEYIVKSDSKARLQARQPNESNLKAHYRNDTPEETNFARRKRKILEGSKKSKDWRKSVRNRSQM